MALLPSAFNVADGGEVMGDRKIYKAGEYNMQITKAELALTKKAKESGKASDGQRLNLEMTFLDGEYAGQIFFRGLNIVNPNQTAVEISMKELRTLGKAVGLNAVVDTNDLLGKPFGMKLKVKAESANKEAENDVVTYKALSGTVVANPALAAKKLTAETPAGDPAAPKKKAWE